MFFIQEKLVAPAIVEESFICNIEKCKGACCWEGDLGAPLEKNEITKLEEIYPQVKPFLAADCVEKIEATGTSVFFHDMNQQGTNLMDDGRCVYLVFDEKKIAHCGIERAYKAGSTDFRKPISCHLYPIRVSKNEMLGFEALNYDKWEICSPACTLGEQKKVKVYQFLKDALVRKYGEDFYNELDAAAQYANTKA